MTAADLSRAQADVRDLALRSGFVRGVESFFAAHDELTGRRFELAGRNDAAEAPEPLRAGARAAGRGPGVGPRPAVPGP